MNRLGIIDWGIGGIGVFQAVKATDGDLPITYFSDTGATPYGKMEPGELAGRLDKVISFLKERGVTHIAIGCNAASTAIPRLAEHRIPIEGIIEPAIAATSKLKPKKLGLIGGRRTVMSGVYRRGFAERGIGVEQRIAQPLSALIESGDVSSDELRAECRRVLGPIRNSSHILLACTHYPAIEDVLRTVVSSNTKLIDPAAALANRVHKWKLKGNGFDVFHTTGDANAMRSAARTAFRFVIPFVSRAAL